MTVGPNADNLSVDPAEGEDVIVVNIHGNSCKQPVKLPKQGALQAIRHRLFLELLIKRFLMILSRRICTVCDNQRYYNQYAYDMVKYESENFHWD